MNDSPKEALAYFLNFDLNPALLDEVLRDHPGLVGEAAEWGWTDTEVRDQLADRVTEKLVGRTWPMYGDNVDVEVFEAEVRRAHEHWVGESVPPTQP